MCDKNVEFLPNMDGIRPKSSRFSRYEIVEAISVTSFCLLQKGDFAGASCHGKGFFLLLLLLPVAAVALLIVSHLWCYGFV